MGIIIIYYYILYKIIIAKNQTTLSLKMLYYSVLNLEEEKLGVWLYCIIDVTFLEADWSDFSLISLNQNITSTGAG